MNILFTLVEIAIDYWLEIFVGILLSVVFFLVLDICGDNI